MKYNYLIISILFAQMAFAQSARYIVSPNPNTIFFTSDISDHNAHGKTVNKTNGNLNILWTREIVMLPAGWSSYVCDANNCYADFIGKCPEGKSNVIKSYDSTTLDVHVFDDGTEGQAHIIMWIYEKEDTSKKYRADYSFNKVVTANREVKTIETKVYPNPAFNSFSVEFNTGLKRVELYSILGRKVMTYPVTIKGNYDISFLDDGLYFIKLIGPDEQMLRTVRLQKRSYKP